MIINSVHSVAVVEECCRSARSVGQHSMKSPVQASRKGGVLLVDVDQIGRPFHVELMPSLLEAASCSRLWVLLSRKEQNDVPSFVLKGHSVGEGVLPRGPPYIHARRLINPCARGIERLVAKRLNHPQQLRLGKFARHLRDKTDNSRHVVFAYETSATPGNLRLYQAFRSSRILAMKGSGKWSTNRRCSRRRKAAQPMEDKGT